MISGWRHAFPVPVYGPMLGQLVRAMLAEDRVFVYVREDPFSRFGVLWVGAVPKKKRPLCGARCRDGHACTARVIDRSTRCRLHGGLSTGPRTAEGRARIAESNRTRGRR